MTTSIFLCISTLHSCDYSILDVILGPFTLPTVVDSSFVTTSDSISDTLTIYRTFPLKLPFTYSEPCCMITEDWGLGILGKIWDSSVILSQRLISQPIPWWLKNIEQRTNHNNPKDNNYKIIDLSSGTGHLTSILSSILLPSKNISIGCTDLPDAIPLIKCNLKHLSNLPVTIAPVSWGQVIHPPVSLIIGSDLLYEAELIPSLVITLTQSLIIGGYVILGYKPRGLSIEEEESFFSLMLKNSYLQLVSFDLAGIQFGVLIFIFKRIN